MMRSTTRLKPIGFRSCGWIAFMLIMIPLSIRCETVKHAFDEKADHSSSGNVDHPSQTGFMTKSILEGKRWTYLSNDEINTFIFNLHIKYANLTRFYSIGNSNERKTMWVLVLSNSPMQRPLYRPMFKYTANIHGNEPLGRQLIVYLAEHLLQNYGKVPRITRLLSSVEVHLLFSANPDGYEKAIEGDCSGNDSHSARNNSHNVDLDTDFPFTADLRHKLPELVGNKQPETVALMSWIVSNSFVLSGSLHSGIFLVSYPFDHSRPGAYPTTSADNPTADNDIFVALAANFVRSRLSLQENSMCYDSEKINITNGAEFAEINGK
jgi:carboxypeptidase D